MGGVGHCVADIKICLSICRFLDHLDSKRFISFYPNYSTYGGCGVENFAVYFLEFEPII
jgi:hypothetical protein